jgi:transcriptional regulator with XRE-family HTH domain
MTQDLIAINSPDDIAVLIKTRRKALCLSQDQLSSLTGIPQPNLSKIERGESAATIQTYLTLFASLGIDFYGAFRT